MPYWRLSGFYLFYFASLGALLPYWGLYLKSLQFDESSIGTLMAIIMATKIISPNVWGWIADHTGRRMAIVRFGSLCAALSFAAVFFADSFIWLALVMMVFSFFWNAALPQFEATTFNHLREQIHRYSSVRLWGSIGFIAAVWLLGEILEGEAIRYLPLTLLILFIAIWISSLLVPEDAAGHLALDHAPLHKVLTQPVVAGLLLACFLMQAGHGPYYTFYSIYMQEYDYSLGLIGGLWALGVIVEVLVFMLMHKLVPRYGLRNLLLFSMLMAVIRWLLTGLMADNLPLMVFAQALHGATFGIYHAAAIQLIHAYFTGGHQGRGQALYSSLSFGAGGAVGSLFSGYIYEYAGAVYMYLVAAVISFVGMYVIYRYIEPPEALNR